MQNLSNYVGLLVRLHWVRTATQKRGSSGSWALGRRNWHRLFEYRYLRWLGFIPLGGAHPHVLVRWRTRNKAALRELCWEGGVAIFFLVTSRTGKSWLLHWMWSGIQGEGGKSGTGRNLRAAGLLFLFTCCLHHSCLQAWPSPCPKQAAAAERDRQLGSWHSARPLRSALGAEVFARWRPGPLQLLEQAA